MTRLRRTGWAVGLLLVFVGVALIAARWVLSSAGTAQRVARALRDRLDLPVEVEEASVGLTGGSTFGGLRVPDAGDPSTPLVSIDRVETDLSALGALSGGLPKQLTLSGVKVTLRFDRSGKLLTAVPGGGTGKTPLPRIDLRGVEVTLRQEGRAPVVLHGKDGTIESTDEGVTLTGSIVDPYWGDWSVGGRMKRDRGGIDLTMDATDADVTQEKLNRLPFVDPSVWKEVQAEGRTPVHLTAHVGGGESDVHYRIEMQPRDTRVHVAAIDLRAEKASGRLIIDDARVLLKGVKGRAAGGALAVDGELDFTGPASRFGFKVRADDLAVSDLPAAWKLPVQSGRLTGQADLKLTVRNGTLETHGEGKGRISGVEFAGGTGTIDLRLSGDGRRLRFQSAAPASAEELIPVVYRADDAPRQGWLDVPAGLAARTASVLADGVGRFGAGTHRVLQTLAAIDRPPPPGTPGEYLEMNLSFTDVQLEQLLRRFVITPPVPISGRLSFRLQVAIPVNTPRNLRAYRLNGSVDVPEARIADLRMEAVKARLDYRDGVATLTELSGRFPQADLAKPGSFAGKARLGVMPPGDLDFALQVNDLSLAMLDALLLPAEARGLAGIASGTISGKAPFAALRDPGRWRADLDLRSPEATVLGLRARNAAFAARLEKGELTVDKVNGTVEGSPVRGTATVRLAAPRRVDARVVADSFDLAGLRRLPEAYRPPVELAGIARIEATAKGPLDGTALDLGGTLRSAQMTVARVRLTSAFVRLTMDKAALRLDDIQATAYAGTITGAVRAPTRETETGRFNLTLKGVDAAEVLRAVAGDVPVRVEGRLSGTVKGTITPAAPGKPRDVSADVDVTAPRLVVQRIPADRLSGTIRYRRGETVYDLQAEALGGKVRLEGRLPAAGRREGASGTLRLRDARVSRLLTALGWRAGQVPLRGVLSLDLPFRLVDGRPVGDAKFVVRGLRWERTQLTGSIRGGLSLTTAGVQVRNLEGQLAGGTVRIAAGYRYRGTSYFAVTAYGIEASQLLAGVPGLEDVIDGPLNIDLRGTLNGGWTGGGTITLTRGRVAGVETVDWRIPVAFRFPSGLSGGEVTIAGSTAQLAGGRATLRLAALWSGGGGARVDGQLQVSRSQLSRLAAASDVGSYAPGRVNATVDFAGSNVRSMNDLSGTIRATLEDTQTMQMPVFAALGPLLNLGGGSSFQNGDLRARLANGVVRVERLALRSASLALYATGTVTLQGRLDLDVTAYSGNNASCPAALLAIARFVPAIGPIPVALLARITAVLANQVVRLHVGGTIRNPVVSVQPVQLLAEDAVRFFLLGATVPAAPVAR